MLIVDEINNHLLHTVRYNDGSWQSQGWGDVTDKLGGNQTTTIRPAITTASGNNQVHISIVSLNGDILHTVRFGNGSWQSQGWGNVTNALAGDVQTNNSPALTFDSTKDEMHITVIEREGEEHLLHSRRFSNGTWQSQGWGDVTNILTP